MTDSISFTYHHVTPAFYWKAAAAACKVKGKGGLTHYAALFLAWVGLVLAMSFLTQLAPVQRGGIAFVVGMLCMWLGLILIGRVQRMRMNRIVVADQEKRGPTDALFSVRGVDFTSSLGKTHLNWRAIDEIVDLGQGTGLRSGLMMYPLPNDALPDGLSPTDFQMQMQMQLRQWRDSATS